LIKVYKESVVNKSKQGIYWLIKVYKKSLVAKVYKESLIYKSKQKSLVDKLIQEIIG